MEAIFGSIVVDPFVFYAVLTGLVLVLIVLIILMVKSKMRRKSAKLEPVTIVEPVEKVKTLLDQEEVKVDIQTINKETPVVKQEVKSDLSDMLKHMENNVGAPKEKDAIDTFERMQEEKAIISYKELLEVKAKQEPFKDEPITFEEPIETINIDVQSSTDDLVKRFRTSDVISPVFGIVDDNTVYPDLKPLEKIQIVEPVKEETLLSRPVIKPTPVTKEGEDFLASLKDFRKNLE